jgi:hypothetical protein
MTMGSESSYFAPIEGAKYIQLTTYRRDGTAVATPVNVVVEGGHAFFRTWDVSGKAKRIRRRGAPIQASATLLQGAESDHAAALIAKKHPVLHGWVIPRVHRLRGWKTQQFRLGPPPGS